MMAPPPYPTVAPIKREAAPPVPGKSVTAETVVRESAAYETVPVHSVTRKTAPMSISIMSAATVVIVAMRRMTGSGPTKAAPMSRPTAAVLSAMSSPTLSCPMVARAMVFVAHELKVFATSKPAPANEA
jgi:hypothetical protein